MRWNAQGITTRTSITQLERILQDKQIDVIFINETFLKPQHQFRLSNYKVYRKDRNTHGGGVLIAIKNTIPHEPLPTIRTTTIENVSIVIEISGRPTRLTSAYCPRYTPNFSADLNKITTSSRDFFVFGDFNAHHTSWNCNQNNAAGKCLYNHQIQDHFYIHAPISFTRFGQRLSNTQPSVVDILLTNSSFNISQIETHPGILSSDHVPITCEIFGTIIDKQPLVRLYNLADWNSIRRWVDEKIQSFESEIITESNIEQVLMNITNTLQEADGKIPVRHTQTWQRRLSKLSLYLIGQRNRYRRKLQRSQLFQRPFLISVTKQLTHLIEVHISKDFNTNWNNFLRKLPTGSKNFWKITKAIRGKKICKASYF